MEQVLNIIEAKLIVNEKLKGLESESNIKLLIIEDETIEFQFGWLFFYQSEEFVKTGNMDSIIGGNASLIVDKFNSSIHVTGTRMSEDFYIEKYCKHRDNIEQFYSEIR